MGFYDIYVKRSRNSFGIKIKKKQNLKIFNLALSKSELLKPDIIEIGPGDGYIAGFAVEKGFSYCGIDASGAICDNLTSRGYKIINSKIPPFPKEINSTDIIFLLHVIEHLSSINDAENFLLEIKKILNKNGAIIIATPDYNAWKQYFYDCDYTHQLPFTRRKLVQLLNNCGYEIVYNKYYSTVIFNNFFSLLSNLLFKLIPMSFLDFVGSRNDILYRGIITILPSIIIIAKTGKNELSDQ